MLKNCPDCDSPDLTDVEEVRATSVDGRRFEAHLHSHRCGACGNVFRDLKELSRFEFMVAEDLASLGARSADAFKFMRKALGLRAVDLAKKFKIAPETISRWENAKVPVDPIAMLALSMFVLDKRKGSTHTDDLLQSITSRRRGAVSQAPVNDILSWVRWVVAGERAGIFDKAKAYEMIVQKL